MSANVSAAERCEGSKNSAVYGHGARSVRQSCAFLWEECPVTDGWKVVPIKATNEMLAAARSVPAAQHIKDGVSYNALMYTTMILAAPLPPAERQDVGKTGEGQS